jgi:hypothetical protein
MTGATMARQNICYSDDPLVQDAHRAVSALVRLFRALGHKNEHAIELTAGTLDITPRRAWNLRYLTQPARMLRQQRDLLLHRAWSAMDRQAAELRRRADEIERQAEAERLADAQLLLPLVLEGACSDCSAPRGICSAPGGRSRDATAAGRAHLAEYDRLRRARG